MSLISIKTLLPCKLKGISIIIHRSISGNSQCGSKRFRDKEVHWNFVYKRENQKPLYSYQKGVSYIIAQQ
jgi:hypothetical protein